MPTKRPTAISSWPHPGDPVDLAPFAWVRWWTGTERHDLHTHDLPPEADGTFLPGYDPQSGEWQIGLEWPEPRDIRQVLVRFTDHAPSDLRVEYWRKNWPTPAPERRPGARRGWIGRDDPWHGRWTVARAAKTMEGTKCSFTFDPVDLPEIGDVEQLNEAEHYLARFRRTLKVRLVGSLHGKSTPPRVAELHAYSSSVWREGKVDIRFNVGQATKAIWRGQVEAANGYILAVESLASEAGDRIESDGSWQSQEGIRLRILFASSPADDGSPFAVDAGDRTIITLRTDVHSFSFLVTDLARGPIYIPDYGVFITWADSGMTWEAFQTQWAQAPKPIYDRVSNEPEQSLSRALAEIPPLDVTKQEPLGRYLPLGVEAGRQEFALRFNGELFLDKRHLKLAGRDAARLIWPSHQLRFRFGTGDPPDFRERRGGTEQSLLDGWLPVVISRWLDREIEYEETAFAALLDGPMTDPDARRGDEDVIAMVRFRIRNTTHGQKRARLWISIAPQEQIQLDGELLIATGRVVPAETVTRQWRVAPYEGPVLRLVIHISGQGDLVTVAYADQPDASQAIPTAVVYEVDLDGGEAHAITMAIPFASLIERADWQKVAGLDFEAKLADVVGYWRNWVESGGQIQVPDAILSDFHKAARTHVAISVDKDPESGLIVVPAATWTYGACGNEACWQITMLDQAGHHDRARVYLETFLRTQGALIPDGLFTSAEGALQGLDLDGGVPRRSSFGYNLDHGYIMECLAHHYRYTGDRAWLERVAPNLVAACEFIIRERQSTMVIGPDGKSVPEWGLLPAGHLEDNPEWRHWFAVNAHAYAGMQAIAEALAEIDHPEAERLGREAVAYREDIRQAARRAMIEAPVVRLLDGTYVPHVPTRTGLRGREWGWFREAAYGALHLMECGVFEPNEPEVTWLLKDLEDNLFVSREWGRPVDLERYWFSHGGVTIQPNLMDLAIDYLRRGQVEHGLRALFNNFGSSLYPDVRTFTEHPALELGHGVGPFYKAPDESKSLIWLRAFLLREEGKTLHVAPGAPRAWLTPGQTFGVERMASFFGPVSYRVEASNAEVFVQIELTPGRLPQELMVHLRRPDRRPIQSVIVNGYPHLDFNAATETVRVAPVGESARILVRYG
jgi:hypothetical protein